MAAMDTWILKHHGYWETKLDSLESLLDAEAWSVKPARKGRGNP